MSTIRLIPVFAIAGLLGCTSQAAQKAAPTPPPRLYAMATASEVFALRSKCAELADKILENNIIGNALTQDVKSHYAPDTNRCYVELDVSAADLTQFNEHPYSRYLYDGQTKEILATSKREKDLKTGMIFVPNDMLAGYDKANAMIDSLMADDRKQ